MKISIIPAFEDNYFFVLHDPDAARVAVVDPGEAAPVVNFLHAHDCVLDSILLTHHHSDHTGGVQALAEAYPHVAIYGNAHDRRLPTLTHPLEPGASITLFGRKVRFLPTPGHTSGHCVYAFEPTNDDPLDIFCGDTLFGAGCGGLLGGTMEQLFQSSKMLREFPDNTRLWCAHEYTEKNLWVATQLDPEHRPTQDRYAHVKAMRAKDLKTVPLTLKTEKLTNPFLRFDDPHLKRVTGTTTDLETFAAVRRFRDQF